LEFTVPFEDTFEVCERFINLYKKLYEELDREGSYPSALPYTLFEVRFTPEHDRTLIGAGRGRRSTWTEKENDGIRNVKNRLYMRYFPTRQYLPGKL